MSDIENHGNSVEHRKEQVMAIVFITGSTDGLGRAAAQSLLDDGHRVVLHARSADRAATIAELASRSAGIVVGDLRSAAETRSIADQVNAIGRMDAVIHNAGVYTERSRGSTPEGHVAGLEQRRRSRLGAHKDGWPRSPGGP
jgi:NAD(P)-dependent dehydrogenase (short-subunit alcohol dehydrogenase family)